MTIDAALVGARFFHFGAAMLVFGASVFPYYARAPARFPIRGASALALLSGAAWLCCTIIIIEGSFAATSLSDVGQVLVQTGFGRAWMIHLAFGALLVVVSCFPQRLWIAFASGANLVTLAGIGHAAIGEGIAQGVHVLGYAAHLCAGAVWLGGLIPLWRACAVLETGERRALVRRFSAIGYFAVAVVVMTGALNVRFVTGEFMVPWRTPYGQWLALKLGLVAALLMLALYNQFVASRRDQAAPLRIGIGAELAAFAGILGAVSWLGVTPPM